MTLVKRMYSLLLAVAVTVPLAGCNNQPTDRELDTRLELLAKPAEQVRLGVQDQGAGEYMFIRALGPKEWYSALELDRIARKYAEEHKLDFSFDEQETNVWVETDDGPLLATVDYSSGIGEPFLRVAIDRYGKATGHETGIAVCGVPLPE